MIYFPALAYIFYSDFTRRRIPNWCLLALTAIAFLVAIIRRNLLESLLGGVICLSVMLIIRLLAKRGIGMGDIKLAGVMGLIVGLDRIWLVIVLSWVLAAGAVLLVNGTKSLKGKTFPFGCSMSAATALVYLLR